MSQDPKIVNPNLWPNPNKIKFADLYKYQGVEMTKINASIKNYKAAKFYVGKKSRKTEAYCCCLMCMLLRGMLSEEKE